MPTQYVVASDLGYSLWNYSESVGERLHMFTLRAEQRCPVAVNTIADPNVRPKHMLKVRLVQEEGNQNRLHGDLMSGRQKLQSRAPVDHVNGHVIPEYKRGKNLFTLSIYFIREKISQPPPPK